MKKIYMIPATKVVKIELQQIIAASLNGLGENGGKTKLTDENADSNADGWSRRGGLWDDDED